MECANRGSGDRLPGAVIALRSLIVRVFVCVCIYVCRRAGTGVVSFGWQIARKRRKRERERPHSTFNIDLTFYCVLILVRHFDLVSLTLCDRCSFVFMTHL
jgi:hypothetical protein